MVQEAFNRAFAPLLGAFHRYHAGPRSPDNVRQLGSARITLDDARSTVRDAREDLLEYRGTFPYPVKQTGVDEDDLARLRVLGAGFVQG